MKRFLGSFPLLVYYLYCKAFSCFGQTAYSISTRTKLQINCQCLEAFFFSVLPGVKNSECYSMLIICFGDMGTYGKQTLTLVTSWQEGEKISSSVSTTDFQLMILAPTQGKELLLQLIFFLAVHNSSINRTPCLSV